MYFFLERCEWEKRSIVKCAFSVECNTRISSFGEVFYADVKYVDACGSLNMKIFNLNDNKRSWSIFRVVYQYSHRFKLFINFKSYLFRNQRHLKFKYKRARQAPKSQYTYFQNTESSFPHPIIRTRQSRAWRSRVLSLREPPKRIFLRTHEKTIQREGRV